MAGYNIRVFLIKQRRYKTGPLVIFYYLVVLLAILRLQWSIMYYWYLISFQYFPFLLEPVLLINIGIVQCWMILEIALRITQDLKLYEVQMRRDGRKEEQMKKSLKIEKFIKYGRKVMIFIVLLETTLVIIWLSILSFSSD